MFDDNNHPVKARPFWDAVQRGEIVTIVPDVLDDELANAPQRVKDFFDEVPESQIERVLSTKESDELAARYIAEGVVGRKNFNDCVDWPETVATMREEIRSLVAEVATLREEVATLKSAVPRASKTGLFDEEPAPVAKAKPKAAIAPKLTKMPQPMLCQADRPDLERITWMRDVFDK